MKAMKELKEKLEVIKGLTGRQNIAISYAACYGGYKLVYLTDKFGEADVCVRMPRKEFVRYLDGMIEGLTMGRVQAQLDQVQVYVYLSPVRSMIPRAPLKDERSVMVVHLQGAHNLNVNYYESK